MVDAPKIQTKLESMFYTFASIFSMSSIVCNIIVGLIAILRYYAFPEFEPPQYSFLKVILAKAIGIIGFTVLYIICQTRKSKVIMILILNLLPIMIFETLAITNSCYEGYIVYLMFMSSLREIILFNVDTKFVYLAEAFLNIYHLMRALIYKHYHSDFPFILFLQFYIANLSITFPSIENYFKIKEAINESDKLKRDLAAIVSSLPIPIFKFSINPKKIYVANDEFVFLKDKIEIKSDSEFIDQFIEKSNVLSSINDNRVSGSMYYTYALKQYTISVRVLEENEGDYYIASIQDLTLLKENESLKAKEAYKQMFISVINHQLRTPLNGIYFPLSMLKQRCQSDDTKELIEVAYNSLEILTSLINDTIAFSECENNKMKVVTEPYHIMGEINKIRKIFAIDENQKSIPLIVKFDIKHPIAILDIKKINQILIILISNAFKYTFKGSILLHCLEEGAKLIFMVQDTGIGIKKEYIDTVFTEFGNVDHNNSEKKTSSGFQLSLVKKLITIMGGTIQVKSIYGEGTKFTIELSVEWKGEYESNDKLIQTKTVFENKDFQCSKENLGRYSINAAYK